jgi:hypothetical protein
MEVDELSIVDLLKERPLMVMAGIAALGLMMFPPPKRPVCICKQKIRYRARRWYCYRHGYRLAVKSKSRKSVPDKKRVAALEAKQAARAAH